MGAKALPAKNLVLIAFGANLGDRHQTYALAQDLLQKALPAPDFSSSPVYETAPLLPPEDPTPQPNYLNSVFKLTSTLPPEAILQTLLQIEKALGRVRTTRWAPRVIDLDLLAVGNEIRNSAELTLPHKELHKRDFVLKPLCDIAPNWQHPILNETASTLLGKMAFSANS